MPTKDIKINKKAIILFFAGLLAICIVAVAIVYFWRVAYEPSFVNATTLTLYTVLFFSLIYTCACGIIVFLKNKQTLKTALLIFLAGLVFVFVSGPMQPPDEQGHFFRSYAISQGQFDFDQTREYTGDVAALNQAFPMAYMNGYCQSMSNCFANYHELAQTGQANPTKEAVVFQIIPYIPQALFILISRILGFSALGQFYAARIGALAFYSVMCFFALKNCDRYKSVMTAVMFLPISLYIASSCSYDGLLISGSYLLFSFFCKEKITTKDLPLLVLSCAVSAVKWPQLMLALIILFIPKEHWAMQTKKQKRISPWLVVGGIIAITIAINIGMEMYAGAVSNFGAIDRWNPDVDITKQLAFVFSNPLRYIAVLFFSLYENSFYLTGLGSFGALDTNILMVSFISIISLIFGCFLSAHKPSKDRKTSIVAITVLAIGYIAATITAMYITWTPVGMVRVIGVQIRYFLPAIPFVLAAISWLLSRIFIIKDINQKKAEITAYLLPFICAIFSGVLLFQHTFIGPFVRNLKIF